MSLTKAIKFRHLSSKLTREERTRFLSQLVHSHTDILLTSLFQHLAKPNHIGELNGFNNTLSDIIQSREEKPKPLCTTNIKIDQLPMTIIGYVASFLKQQCYCRFSTSNISIYLGCNSPNVLQKLCLNEAKHYSSTKLALFPSVKTLRIDPSKITESQQNMRFDSPNFNQVMTLALAAHYKCGWVRPFFNRNIVNCHHVTTLNCQFFGSIDDRMGRNEFLSLLKKFPNVTQLQLHSVEVTQDVTAQDIAGLCPKLVGLLLANTRLIGDLVKMFASQLQYLAFYHRTTLDFGNVVFDQLEELGIFWPRNQLFCDIVKSAFKLKRLYICYWKERTSHDQIKKSITFVMVQCKCLNYMHFSIGYPKAYGVNTTQFCSVLEGIECGLLKTKQQQRKRLKVCIDVAGLGFKSSDFVLNIGRVINSFCASNVKDFMLIWQFEGVRDNATLDEVFHALCNLSAHIKVIQSEERFIVTNKNCKINGYQNELNFLSASKRF
eukprot:858834_1